MAAFYPLEYLSVLRRWKVVFITVFLALFIISTIYALKWSAYSASATVEVAMPEISMNAMETEGYTSASSEAIADLQINRLKQKVLATNSLSEIIAELNLYPESRQSLPITYLAQIMRKDINFALIGSTLANSAAANKVTAQQLSAIAFTINFTYEDPILAQKAVSELVTRFLSEDLKERRETAEKTTTFLQQQIDGLTESLEEKEREIAEFRSENGFAPSESLMFNQQAALNINSSLLALDSEMTANLGRIGALQAQLAQTDPYIQIVDDEGAIINTPGSQLRMLETRYASLTAKYGPDHPDVLKTSREIKALRAENPSGNVGNADNPAYLQIMAQLNSANKQQEALQEQRIVMQQRQNKYEEAIASNPEAEQKMASLARDYENMMSLYRELKTKKLASDMSKTIEDGHVGRRLAVIDPAEVPLSTNPPKKLIFAGGVIFAFIAASAIVVLLQLLTQSIIGPHHLQSLVGVAPLARIPHIKKRNEDIGSEFEKSLNDHNVVAHLTRSKEADQYRFLRTQILQMMSKGGYKTLAISSPRYGEGKSTIASNLAVSIAQDLKQTVLLVDLDLRKPSIAGIFNIKHKLGLTDYLADKANVKDCLMRPPFERISVFPAGHAIDQSSETLGSPEMEKLALELRERYDDRIIIYDMPPLLQQDDPLVFLPYVDCFALVVREGITTGDDVNRSLEILKPANVLGIVLNEI